ncbi:unnamed protein product [Leptidea sinapis]|uniref:Uncharacterized protein n=1 Tax=Leptidea sinapis TaxID=189913 RepID=A0A5E4QJ37_9NEOP|nr:unnamed protein product [Leptidea sinapis]
MMSKKSGAHAHRVRGEVGVAGDVYVEESPGLWRALVSVVDVVVNVEEMSPPVGATRRGLVGHHVVPEGPVPREPHPRCQKPQNQGI